MIYFIKQRVFNRMDNQVVFILFFPKVVSNHGTRIVSLE